ncbi:protein kinase [uncultured Paraglaciecola sp.]|uniref:protein kinase domain-containing protein n=1 Tax=uncultured Paraglaciecola sp. TaxID=1765024 RepID=UPI0030DCC45C
MTAENIKHFYIPDEQSIYLLSHKDAKKLKDWFKLCTEQLQLLGYQEIELIGKGAFGFAFAGTVAKRNGSQNAIQPLQQVFKFSRINLPQHVQDRLEEEAYMLSLVSHPYVPRLIEYQKIKKQSVLVMDRAKGEDLEKISLKYGPLSVRLVIKIAAQLADILLYLRGHQQQGQSKPIVHGDIKPSNIVFDESSEKVGLIDWGSSVFAQLDHQGQFVGNNVMDLMSSDMQQTNARLGDVYFIGDDQLNGGLSSVRFDEQGLASTLYALASGQSSRFGHKVITPNSLGLPQELAKTLTAMMSDSPKLREQGGDYFIHNMQYMKNVVLNEAIQPDHVSLIPSRVSPHVKEIDTVVYSSRKSFLRIEAEQELRLIDDAQFERYYKNYMQGMGDTEKAFVAAVSRLGKYPLVGGLAVRWEKSGVFIDSSLNLYDLTLIKSFEASLNNIVHFARAINRIGVFKCCMFNARDTLHVERSDEHSVFIPERTMQIPFELSEVSLSEHDSRMHSYFEDGDDPDELLTLPLELMAVIRQLNSIHHTGCIIFESLPTHLKIHSDYKLLNHSMELEFKSLLKDVIDLIPTIEGLGISGFMKLPFKDTRFFTHQSQLPDRFYPKDPRQKN